MYGSRIGKWLNSRLNRRIQKATALYEKFALRDLALEIFYGVFEDLKWYGKRNKGDYSGLYSFFVKWVPLIAPFMPHYAEEFWEMLRGSGFVAKANFPNADEKVISDEIETGEVLVVKVRDDVENLQNLLKIKPKHIHIFVANDTKRKIYSIIAKEKSFDKIMKAASSDPELKTKMDIVQKMAKMLAKNVHSLPSVVSAKDELEALSSADSFIENEFSCEVSVSLEDESKHERAKNAMPGKPAIVIE
jgi:leucyl-tRNA synthetase